MVLDNALALGSRVTAAFGQSYATSEEWASLLASRYGAENVSGGAAESIITASPYGDLSGTLPEGFQANHLNQNAVYRAIIPQNEGLAVGVRGDAFAEPGTPHYNFHQSMEQFWEQYRTGALRGLRPTNSEYSQALVEALQAGSYSPTQAADLAAQAAAQRAAYGLPEAAPVPRIPGRINQVEP